MPCCGFYSFTQHGPALTLCLALHRGVTPSVEDLRSRRSARWGLHLLRAWEWGCLPGGPAALPGMGFFALLGCRNENIRGGGLDSLNGVEKRDFPAVSWVPLVFVAYALPLFTCCDQLASWITHGHVSRTWFVPLAVSSDNWLQLHSTPQHCSWWQCTVSSQEPMWHDRSSV